MSVTSRRHFERMVGQALLRPRNNAVAVLDVEHFNLFKSLHGATAADALLRTIAQRLEHAASAAGGHAVRLGAAEFAVLLPSPAADGALLNWAKLLLSGIAAPFLYRNETFVIAVTMGISKLSDHAETPAGALQCARLAVTHGRRDGGGGVTICSSGQLTEAREREELMRDLPAAIAHGDIVPFYQPIITVATGQISGMEVLARWQHPTRGVLTPAAFIPIVEDQLLCCALTQSLLLQVQSDTRNWPRHWHFAFNTTPREVVALLSFIDGPDYLASNMIERHRIELEVTETALMRDLIESRNLIETFKPCGVTLVLDDFGTGYANFQQLRSIPFGRLKIDKSFVTDMLADPRAAACVQAIINLAHHLGMTATAEGVECSAVANRLVSMGCDHAQGYHYARPMPGDEVAWLISARHAGISTSEQAA